MGTMKILNNTSTPKELKHLNDSLNHYYGNNLEFKNKPSGTYLVEKMTKLPLNPIIYKLRGV